jgi:hypothetical protein
VQVKPPGFDVTTYVVATPSGVKETLTRPLACTVAVGVAKPPPIVRFEAGFPAVVSPPLTVEVVETLKAVFVNVWGVGLTTPATVRVTAVLAAIAQPEVAKVIVIVVLVPAEVVPVQVVDPVPPVNVTTGFADHVKPEALGKVKTIVLPPAKEIAPCAEVVKPTVHLEVSSPAEEPGVNVTAVGVVVVNVKPEPLAVGPSTKVVPVSEYVVT